MSQMSDCGHDDYFCADAAQHATLMDEVTACYAVYDREEDVEPRDEDRYQLALGRLNRARWLLDSYELHNTHYEYCVCIHCTRHL